MNADEFRAYIALKESLQVPFCAAWVASGARTVMAGDLLDLAERVGVPLGGRTVRAKCVSVGRWLGRLASDPIKGCGVVYHVAASTKLYGYQQWTISEERLPETSILRAVTDAQPGRR